MDFVKLLQIFQDGNIFLLWLFLCFFDLHSCYDNNNVDQRDERKKIYCRQSRHSFFINSWNCYFNCKQYLAFVFERQSPLSIEPNPFIYLGAISIISMYPI